MDLTTLTRVAAIVGLDVWIRSYPGGEPLRDVAHLRLTQAFLALLGPGLVVRPEVPIGDARDMRAWDLTLTDHVPRVCGTELETRLIDAQDQMRRIARKRADGQVDRVLIVLADTRANRSALRSAITILSLDYAIDDPAVRDALRRGELPPRDAVILVRPGLRAAL